MGIASKGIVIPAVGDVITQVVENTADIAALIDKSVSYGQLNVPPEISSIFPYNVYLLPNGYGDTDFDILSMRPSGKKYYVSQTGSNSNNGLTPSTPLQTISAAFDKTDVDEIVLFPGDWPRNLGAWNFKTITRNILLTVLGGSSATIFGSDFEGSQAWTVNGTYSNVYQRARSSVLSVYDSKFKTPEGDFLRYPLVADIASVSTTPGSYFTDGTTTYVSLLDGRAPDNDLRVNLTTVCSVNGSGSLYMENINFLGTTFLARSNNGSLVQPTVYGVNCKFKYGHFDGLLGSGSFMSEGANTYLVDCEAARSKRDGFSYHPNSANEFLPFAFELRCLGRDNGLSGEDNDNGSTMHGGGKVLRLNCNAYGNAGPNFVDVGNGTYSYNVGLSARDTEMITDSRNYEVQGRPEGLAYMWLISCNSGGVRDFDARVRPSGYQGYLYFWDTNLINNTGDVSFIQEQYPFL